jgi:hypothetical protein
MLDLLRNGAGRHDGFGILVRAFNAFYSWSQNPAVTHFRQLP